MNFKTTVTLLILLAVVAGFIVFDRYNSAPATDASTPATPKAQKLFATPIDTSANSLDISVEGAEKISLVRDAAGKWRLVAPFAASADSISVSSFLTRISTLESTGEPGEAARKDFKPAVTVTLGGTAAAGGATTLSVSAPNGVGETLARVDSGGTTTWKFVAGTVTEALTKRPEEFRDPRLVTAAVADIRMLTLEHGGRWVRLIRESPTAGGGAPTWTLDEGAAPAPAVAAEAKPGPLRADDEAVQDLLTALTGLRAAEFPKSIGAATAGPAQLTVRVTAAVGGASPAPATGPVTEPASREFTIRFGRWEDARRERVLVTTDDVASAAVTGTTLTSLRKTALELRDKRVLDIRAADVTRVEIINEPEAATRPSAVVLTRKPVPATAPTTQASVPAQWLVDESAADNAAVGALLESLRPLRATAYLSGPAATQPATPWLIRITTASGLTELRVGTEAARFGELTFNHASDLPTQVAGSFKPKPLPIPFVDPADAQPASPSTPTTQP